jgi:hypothetical protein
MNNQIFEGSKDRTIELKSKVKKYLVKYPVLPI